MPGTSAAILHYFVASSSIAFSFQIESSQISFETFESKAFVLIAIVVHLNWNSVYGSVKLLNVDSFNLSPHCHTTVCLSSKWLQSDSNFQWLDFRSDLVLKSNLSTRIRFRFREGSLPVYTRIESTSAKKFSNRFPQFYEFHQLSQIKTPAIYIVSPTLRRTEYSVQPKFGYRTNEVLSTKSTLNEFCAKELFFRVPAQQS